LLSKQLAGVPLGDHWFSAGLFSPHGLVFLGLFVLLGGIAWSSRRLRHAQPPDAVGMDWLVRVLPFGTIVVAALMPLAAGLYLLTTTAWTAMERAIRTARHSGAESEPAHQEVA
jgi:YidC/Oxa1 family membrane protein insertase